MNKIMEGMPDDKKLEVLNDYRARNGWPPLSHLGARDPRAVAKLSFKEMCEIKAYRFCGVPNNIIAIVFDVTSLTVTRINGANPSKYPRVFAEVMAFNTVKEFCDAHITEKNEHSVRELYPSYRRPSSGA